MEENIKFPAEIIIDASTALAFLLPDEKKTKVDFLFQLFAKGKIKILTPRIFYFEVFNGLRSAVLRKRIKVKLAIELLSFFLKLKIKEKKINWKKTFQLALRENISFYDASYLNLAKTEKAELFTLDKLLSSRGV